MSCTGVTHPLEVTLQHLTSSQLDVQQQSQQQQQQQQREEQLLPWDMAKVKEHRDYQTSLSSATARALHRVNRHYRSAARGTCTYLNLDSYPSKILQPCIVLVGSRCLFPWDFLAEAPAVNAISIHRRQVPALLAGRKGIVDSLVGRLRRLQVLYLNREEPRSSSSSSSTTATASSSSSSSWEEDVAAVGRLLALCTNVQVLSLCGGSLDGQDQQLLEASLVAGSSTSTHPRVSSKFQDVRLEGACSSSSRGGSTAAAAEAAAAGSSSRGAGCSTAPVPLLQLELINLPLSTCGAWLQKRGQLRQLRSLSLDSCNQSDFNPSWGWLTSLAGLQELRLVYTGSSWDEGAPDGFPEALTALSSSLSHLSIHNFGLEGDQAQPVAALSALKRLELVGGNKNAEVNPLWNNQFNSEWVTALKQLTHLNLSGSPIQQLPEELGQVLPHLQVLLLGVSYWGDLPKGMTRLTRLEAPSLGGELSDASLAAVCEATALRKLNLDVRGLSNTSCLGALSHLAVLQMRGSGARAEYDYVEDSSSSEFEPVEDSSSGSGPTVDRLLRDCSISDPIDQGAESDSEGEPCSSSSAGGSNGGGGGSSSSSSSSSSRLPLPPSTLPCLVNLRHLDLRHSKWWVSDILTMGGLQHVTYLDLGAALAKEGGVSGAGSLPSVGVLPALQQLNLESVWLDSHQWPAVGAWLGQQPQLTRLSLRDGVHPYRELDAGQQAQGLAQLPTQLVELDLSRCTLQQLPSCLSQMANLRVLLVGVNDRLPAQLPHWLQQLQQLEVLQVERVGDKGARLLRQLPWLRQLWVTDHVAYAAVEPYLLRDLPQLTGGSPGGSLELRLFPGASY